MGPQLFTRRDLLVKFNNLITLYEVVMYVKTMNGTVYTSDKNVCQYRVIYRYIYQQRFLGGNIGALVLNDARKSWPSSRKSGALVFSVVYAEGSDA